MNLPEGLSIEAVGTGLIFVLGLVRGWWKMGSEVKRLEDEVLYWREQYNAIAASRIPNKEKDS